MKTSNKLFFGVFAFITIIYSIFLVSFRLNFQEVEQIVSSGNMTTEKRSTQAFTNLIVNGNFEVELVASDSIGVQVIAPDNLQNIIALEQKGNRLFIRSSNNKRSVLSKGEQITVRVSRNNIHYVQARGNARISSDSLWQHNESFKIIADGSSSIRLALATDKLNATIRGGSQLYLTGTSNNLQSTVSGAGYVSAEKLEAQDVKMHISGAGKASVFAQKTLDVSVSGAGQAYYKGDPNVKKHTSGAGNVQRVE